MILLDTNVVSEVMKVAPSANVLKWLLFPNLALLAALGLWDARSKK